MGERDGAVLALQLLAAGPAQHGKGKPAPVQQDDGLLSPSERSFVRLHQSAREDALLAGLLELGACRPVRPQAAVSG